MAAEDGILTDGFAHIGVSTHDMEATLNFYCEVLGCPRLGDEVFEVGEGGSVRQVSIGVGHGQYIVFMQAKGISSISEDYDTSINGALGVPAGMYHYALRVSSPEALEAVAETLAERGVEASEITDLGIIKSVFFRDPNGLQLELSATLRDFNESDIGRVTKAEVAKD
jgi:catechol 2,3-dioxygenase-like lactoylglutathione lyase family enzyme